MIKKLVNVVKMWKIKSDIDNQSDISYKKRFKQLQFLSIQSASYVIW